MIFLISAMQHPALKELNVNNPQSIWGDSACYNYPALKELNVNNPQFYLGVGSQLSLPSSEGAEYEVHGKYLLSIRIPNYRKRTLNPTILNPFRVLDLRVPLYPQIHWGLFIYSRIRGFQNVVLNATLPED
jgi:hypothetical protein